MGRRRKNDFMGGDDEDSDASGRSASPDFGEGEEADALREEYNHFRPGKKGRRRTRDDAIYGVWNDDDNQDTRRGPPSRGGRAKGASDGIRFVSGSNAANDNGKDAMDVDAPPASSDDDSTDESEMDGEERQMPRDRDEEEGEEIRSIGGLGSARPGLGGLGLGSSSASAPLQPRTGGFGSFGSLPTHFHNHVTTNTRQGSPLPVPTAPTSTQSANLSASKTTSSKAAAPPVRKEKLDADFAKFEKANKGIGLKYLQKMGYVPGQGLGKSGEGIVQPIDVKVRRKGAGLGAAGDERTEAVKRDQAKSAPRYILSDDDEDTKELKKVEQERQEIAESWKRGSKKSYKRKFKTAEELIRDQQELSAGMPAPSVQKQKVIDMTAKGGAREVSEVSELVTQASLAAARDSTSHLVELRHNVRMLCSEAESDLLRLSRALTLETASLAKANEEKARLEARLDAERRRAELASVSMDLARITEAAASTLTAADATSFAAVEAAFDVPFSRIQKEHMTEFVEMGLDELVVAAVAPFVRNLFATWEPLHEPNRGVRFFNCWGGLLRARATPQASSQSYTEDQYFNGEAKGARIRSMTPFEALMYSTWLPRVRAAVNNSWSPREPDSFLRLLEAWCPSNVEPETRVVGGVLELVDPARSAHIIPPWMRANVLVQLLLPKLRSAIDDWDPRSDARNRKVEPTHTWLFPWLPILGEAGFTQLCEPVARKFSILLADWLPEDDSIKPILLPWLEVFSAATSSSLMNKSVLPKLVAHLRFDFHINPASQDNSALLRCLDWRSYFSSATFGHLIETEFFPKWLNVLHAWLSSPGVNYEEVSAWYAAWKGFLPADVAELEGVKTQFRVGLELMNKALSLPEGAPLGPVPVVVPHATITAVRAKASGEKSKTGLPELQRRKEEAGSFRDLIERLASARDMTVLPASKRWVSLAGGKSVLRMGGAPDGRDAGGCVFYVDEAVAYVFKRAGVGADGQGTGTWEPIGLEELVELAHAQRAH